MIYSPPHARADENWITVKATDARGASVSERLYVKNS